MTDLSLVRDIQCYLGVVNKTYWLDLHVAARFEWDRVPRPQRGVEIKVAFVRYGRPSGVICLDKHCS